MSYNIRLNIASDGENAWPKRRNFLANQVNYHLPDVIGTQEGLPEQVAWLQQQLTAYDYVGQGRDGGNKGEYSAVFYNRHKFKVRDSGTFWLSDTPGKISKGWDAALNRVCTWARLEPRNSEQGFLVFNTHFDHRGTVARAKSVDLIMRMIDSLNKDNLPYIVTGDFNLEPESEPIQKLRAKMIDTYDAAPVRLGPAGTFTGFKYDEPASRRIDYVFASATPRTEVIRYATLTDAVNGCFPSDHFPVTATLHLRPRPVIIAHRGASGYALENTLAAFQKAIDLGADQIELDVFTLKDGAVVCFHDDDLERLTGVKGQIVDYTLAELNQLTLSDGSRIPLLSEAMKVMDKQLRLNIELKGAGTAGPSHAIIQHFIKTYGWKIEDFHISSFRHDELKAMRKLDDQIEIGILPRGNALDALDLAKEINAFSINAYKEQLNPESVKTMHAAGLNIYTWTVNSFEDIRRLLDLGIDGIITNYPDRVQKVAAE
jgi:glycerophosphoryl diester phosphodiesterase/endonuclease/exonuclease/phosphatase family metal-dependent hydrolase